MRRVRAVSPVIAVTVAFLAVAACDGSPAPTASGGPGTSSSRTATVSPEATSFSLAPTTTPVVDTSVVADAVRVKVRHWRGPAALPELSDLTYGAGTLVRSHGELVQMPGGRSVQAVYGLTHGFVADACLPRYKGCHLYVYDARRDRMLRLAGRPGQTFVNRAGTLLASVPSSHWAYLYDLRTGQRIARTPPHPAGVGRFNVTGFDGDDVVFRGDAPNNNGESRYRWHPGMTVVEEIPGSHRTDRQLLADWRWTMKDDEVLYQTSPDGRLVFVNDGDGMVSLLKVPARSTFAHRQQLCRCQPAQTVWVDDDKVLLVVPNVNSDNAPSHLATYDASTRRVRLSRSVSFGIRLDRTLENDESDTY